MTVPRRTSARQPLSLLAGAVLLLLLPAAAWATRALDMDWRSLETEHFDVHYYVGEEELARRVASVAEDAYATLVPLFDFVPVDRCQVILTDHLDASNGLTSTIPYDKIVLYAYPPDADGELGSYDDYLHMLFFHEYAHLLHLNTVGGVPWFVNTVLGKTMQPNGVLPKWYVEGIATVVESRVTGRGRVDSSRTDMILRAAVLGGAWLSLDELTGGPLKRPRSSGWYLYGGEFLTWVARQVGFERVVAFQHAYGRRLIPYGLNLLGADTLGRTFADLYDEWSRAIAAEADAVRARVAARGPIRAGVPLTTNAEEHESPRISPDGRTVAWVEYDGHALQNLHVFDFATGASRAVAVCDGYCLGLDWAPDGRHLLFERYAWDGSVYYRRDLFRADVATGAVERLTVGRRVREMDVDGVTGRVAWVATEFGRTALVVWDPATAATRTVVPYHGYDQLEGPRWSPDGTRLVYSAWVDGDGRRDLFVAAADGRTPPRRLTWDDALDLQATWSPDGRHVLWASDPDGIYDLYALRLEDGRRFRVTNVVTGAFQPDVDPNGERIVFAHYGAWGYDVHTMPYRPEEWTPVDSPTPTPPEAAPYDPPAATVATDDDYSPFFSVLPRRIEPTWFLDQTGFGNVGLQLTGSDALDQHTWVASLDYAIQSARLSEALVYTNRQLPVDLGVTFSHFEWDRSAYFDGIETPFSERVIAGSVDAAIPFPNVLSGFSLGVGYTVHWAGDIDLARPAPEPDDLVPYVPEDGLLSGFYVSWSYSAVRKTLYGIDGEEGRSVWLRVSVNHPALGSDYETVALRWQWREHLEAPWARHHVFNVRLTHGIAAGHPAFRGGFSLGGLPPQDLFTALANQQQLSGTHLRGYPASAFSGDQFYLATVEYRFPIWDIFRGIGTFPVWASRVTGAVFVDAGHAFSGPMADSYPRVGVGAELRLQTDLFYSFGASFRLGYAYGVMEAGEHQFYFVLGGWP